MGCDLWGLKELDRTELLSTPGFTSSVSMKHQGPWKGSVLHRQGSHGQLKFSADRVTHSTSLWRVVFLFLLEMCLHLALGKLPALDSELLPWWSSLALTFLG